MSLIKRSRRKAGRSLALESDSDSDLESSYCKPLRKKRKIRGRSSGNSDNRMPGYTNDMVAISDSTFCPDGVIKSICSEIKTVLKEKMMYCEQYLKGAREAYDAKTKKVCELHVNREIIGAVSDNVTTICGDNGCSAAIDSSKSKENDIIKCIDELLLTVKYKRSLLEDKLNRFLNIHNNFVQDLKVREETHTDKYHSIQKDFRRKLSDIQRRVVRQMQKKASEEIKQKLKGLYFDHIEEESS